MQARTEFGVSPAVHARVLLTQVPVCLGTDFWVINVLVMTDVRVAKCLADICPGKELIN